MPLANNRLLQFFRKTTAVLFPLGLLLVAYTLPAAQETNALPSLSKLVITNMNELWTLSPEEKPQLHRIQMELLVYYCDPSWNVFWGNSDGLDTFLPLRGIPLSLKAGDKIRIDGQILRENSIMLKM